MNPQSYKVIFMGTPEFAIPALQGLIDHPHFNVRVVITQPDKPAGRNSELKYGPVKQLALKHGLPMLQPETAKHNPELIQALKNIAPDIIVVAAYGKILPQEIIDLPQYGTINIHASLLPQYRGPSPIAEAIINGDSQTGVTLMKMVLAVDAGPIIARSQPTGIEDSDTTQSLSQKLAKIGAELLLASLLQHLDGEIVPQPQDEHQVTHTKRITKEDGRIDWHEDETIIERQVRAYFPWPSAYTTWDNKQIKILASQFMPDASNPKGQVIKIGNDLFIGRLKIERLQLAGKKPVSGSEFLAGYPGVVGATLND